MSFLIGLTAGAFGGLLGLGGGSLMIPMMVVFLKVTQHKAHGTSLVALVFTGLASAVSYAFHHHVDVASSLILAVAALWPARFGAQCCRLMPEIGLKRSFGYFQISMAVLLVIKMYISPMAVPMAGWAKIATLLATGVATGFLSGLMGIGGGAIMIAAMVLLVGYDQHTAQGSALLAMIPAGAVGAFTHWRLKNVDTILLKGLIPGIILGALIGAAIAQFLPEAILRIVFAAVLILMGTRLIRTKTATVCE
jgi:uncharacterized protein